MKKMNNKRGFTLAELLIVVAIIAVLVAISIPIFTSQLEKSREATDLANLRSAYAAATTKYLSEDITTETNVYYNAGTGALAAEKTGIAGYGKGTATDGGTPDTVIGGYTYDATTSVVSGQVIKAAIAANGTVTLSWEAAA